MPLPPPLATTQHLPPPCSSLQSTKYQFHSLPSSFYPQIIMMNDSGVTASFPSSQSRTHALLQRISGYIKARAVPSPDKSLEAAALHPPSASAANAQKVTDGEMASRLQLDHPSVSQAIDLESGCVSHATENRFAHSPFPLPLSVSVCVYVALPCSCSRLIFSSSSCTQIQMQMPASHSISC